jgi:uracil-DNA glycosylase
VSRRTFPTLLAEIRACRVCAPALAHEPRPVLRARPSARLVIVGQAPGTRVHASGTPFTDPSGDRLRRWLDVDSETFYDERRVAIIPMGFCFPGLDESGGDLPPRKECGPLWREKLLAELKQVKLTLLVGQYAQAWHLKERRRKTLTETVQAWRAYGPEFVPLPHPSWRNNGWVKKNPWFETELIPALRKRVVSVLAD